MKAGLICLLFTAFAWQLPAQQHCRSYEYMQDQLRGGKVSQQALNNIEAFTQQYISSSQQYRIEGSVITIPVIVHNLYHTADQKITDAQVQAQLDLLNTCFRRNNADTVNTPAVFKSLGADIEIEFKLATSDPMKRYTTGIIRKYTPVTEWKADDKMKLSSETGDDAWEPSSYLNIWVCNLDRFAGYASFPGGEDKFDGIVLGLPVVKDAKNKTIVHETGHWLNLRHIWGDEYCGDDFVGDTPKQASYTPGCPNVVRITCGNGPYGDMYSNYMDFTSDACTNLFTHGQKARMRALFSPGGARATLLSSKGLNPPLIFEIPVPNTEPKWLEARVYPNPATQELTLDLSYDARWVGKEVRITGMNGQPAMLVKINSPIQKINVSKLSPGMYVLAAKREDGVSVLQKFIKL